MRAFVIAMPCEADAVRPALGPDDRLYVCGIGKVNAAAVTQKAIDEGATEILNAGLCGGFGSRVEVGGCYEVKSAVEYDFDLAKLNGTRIGQHNERTTPYFELKTTGKFPSCILATGDRFNDSETDYRLIAEELGAELRDMEGAAIAHVCELSGIPCRALKCVSNVAGRGSMTGQYQDNRARSLECLKNVVISWK